MIPSSRPLTHWFAIFDDLCIALFPILADEVQVKTGSWSTAHWSTHFIRLSGWLRSCFTQLIMRDDPLDIDSIGQNGEDSSIIVFSEQ